MAHDKVRALLAAHCEELAERGLHIGDWAEAMSFLAMIGVRRFDHYARYWTDPTPMKGPQPFDEGARFEEIRSLYEAERDLSEAMMAGLRRAEVGLRAQFALHFEAVSGSPRLLVPEAAEDGAPNRSPAEVRMPWPAIMNDLARSKEPHIVSRRRQALEEDWSDRTWQRFLIAETVDTLTFGTLARCIEQAYGSGVSESLEDALGTPRGYLKSQVRALVYLRNRGAHLARLWNHTCTRSPELAGEDLHAASRYRVFVAHSVYEHLLVISVLLRQLGCCEDWLGSTVEPLLEAHPALALGITHPYKYGQ
ncbi:Abi family protein [Schaalia sp. Marseille-Q2122]|uniref:Abi family protein n=1 Tax=Schaalia sp. Marseille-Q2122 TaxID=2736604 RepID=UPI0015894536|nr:Abi family protein [Schaalia sp. Marseille-Q2122]